MELLGVDVKLNTRADAEMLRQLKADAVILAVGATIKKLSVPCADEKMMANAVEVLLGEKHCGSRVVMVGGGLVGCETALWLAQNGKEVTVVEMLDNILASGKPVPHMNKDMLINLMKQAGYKTFWITNQQTMTKRNTMLTTFAQQTDAQFYLNNQRSQNASQLDGAVLAPFAKVLDDPAPKKFIVVHLLGTHMNYKYRYPADYARFVDRQGAPAALSDDQVEVYNSYDNAVLYNDYVVSSLIKGFANSDPNGFLVYLSDHGEEVFDEAPHDRLGRNEGDPTRGMYTVPFLVWTSPSWQQTHPRDLQALVDRRYSSEDLIHTWSDLAGLDYDLFDPTKSLVSNDFQHEVRWIGNPYAHNGLRDFDKLPLDKADAGQQVAQAGRPAPTTPRAPSRQPNEG